MVAMNHLGPGSHRGIPNTARNNPRKSGIHGSSMIHSVNRSWCSYFKLATVLNSLMYWWVSWCIANNLDCLPIQWKFIWNKGNDKLDFTRKRSNYLASMFNPWFDIIRYYIYMVVSWNRVTSKLSILMGCSLLNQPFWDTPIYGNPHISEKTLKIDQRNVTIDHQPVGEICRHIPSVLKHQMQNWQTLESTIPKQHGHDVQHFWCFRHRKRNTSSLISSLWCSNNISKTKKKKLFSASPMKNYLGWWKKKLFKTGQLCQFSSAQGLLLPSLPDQSALSSRRIQMDFQPSIGGVDRSLLGWLVEDKSLQKNILQP